MFFGKVKCNNTKTVDPSFGGPCGNHSRASLFSSRKTWPQRPLPPTWLRSISRLPICSTTTPNTNTNGNSKCHDFNSIAQGHNHQPRMHPLPHITFQEQVTRPAACALVPKEWEVWKRLQDFRPREAGGRDCVERPVPAIVRIAVLKIALA